MSRFIDLTYPKKTQNASLDGLPIFASADPSKNKHKNNLNSQLAYKRANITGRRKEILELIQKRGRQGATLEEVAEHLKVEKNTISGRFSELKAMQAIEHRGDNRNGFAVYVEVGA